jgi:hypothetical protein
MVIIKEGWPWVRHSTYLAVAFGRAGWNGYHAVVRKHFREKFCCHSTDFSFPIYKGMAGCSGRKRRCR